MYVFDTSPLSNLFRNFYRGRFPTLWNRFDVLVANGQITSTREVARELDRYGRVDENWMRDNRAIFAAPTAEEAEFVREIYNIAHFRQNIEVKKIQKGGLNADPFVVAKAAVNDSIVITLERMQPNVAKIPNICADFNLQCFNLEEFMEEEGWQF